MSARRITKYIALCVVALFARRTPAQPTTTLQPDARVLPRRAIGARLLTSWTRWDEMFGVPAGSPSSNAAWSFNTDSLGPAAIPQLSEGESAIRTLSGLSAFRLTAGKLAAAADSRIVTAPLILEYGLTDRITLGAVIPLVETRSVISARLNPALGDANVGPNPGLTNTGVRSNAASLVSSFRSAATELQQHLTQCQATPSGSGCDVLLAQQSDVTALVQTTGTVAGAVETLYGTDETHPGQLFVPIASSPAQAAIDARIQGLIAQYQKFLPTTSLSGGVIGAGGPPALQELRALLASAGLDSLGVDRASIGDVSLGATWQLVNSLTDSSATHGYRFSASGSFRFGTGQPASRNRLFDVGTGYGQPGIQIGAAADAVFNRRYSGSAIASYTKQLGSVDVVRIPNPANAVFPFTAPTPGSYTAGDVLWLSLVPRMRVSGYLTLNALYTLTHVGADQYTPDAISGGTAGVASSTTHAIGFGFSYSTVSMGGITGRTLPVELTFSHLETISGSGGPVAKAFREQIGVRAFLLR